MKIKKEITHSLTLSIFSDKKDAYHTHTKMLLAVQQAGLYDRTLYSVSTNDHDNNHESYKFINVFDELDQVYGQYYSNSGIYFRYYIDGLEVEELDLLNSYLDDIQESR